MILVTIKHNGSTITASGVTIQPYGWVDLYSDGQLVARGNDLNQAIQTLITQITWKRQ